jgi:putative sterol carrier protein
MEAQTPQEFIDKILPHAFEPAKATGIDIVAQLTVVGANGGDWIIIIKNQKLDATQGVATAPNLSLQMTEKDFLDLVNHKISAEKAFFSGKIQFKGNITLALKLRDAGFF